MKIPRGSVAFCPCCHLALAAICRRRAGERRDPARANVHASPCVQDCAAPKKLCAISPWQRAGSWFGCGGPANVDVAAVGLSARREQAGGQGEAGRRCARRRNLARAKLCPTQMARKAANREKRGTRRTMRRMPHPPPTGNSPFPVIGNLTLQPFSTKRRASACARHPPPAR